MESSRTARTRKRMRETTLVAVSYAAVGFSAADEAFMDALDEHPRGWRSAGFALRRKRPEDAPSGSPHFIVFLTEGAVLDGLYPQAWLRGLSVTDRSQSPIHVHIRAQNWQRVPPESEYRDLAAYRAHLLRHEQGHALGLGHAACSGAGAPADVMMQASRPLAGCVTHPWVDGGTTATAHPTSVYAAHVKPRPRSRQRARCSRHPTGKHSAASTRPRKSA